MVVTDGELVERACGGDVAAWRQLVDRHQAFAQRTAYVVTGRSQVAEIIEDSFAKAYLTLGRLRAGDGFRPWLATIVANEARNRRRGDDRARALTARLGHLAPVAAPSVEEAAVLATERAAVLAAVNRLRDDDRLVIGYRYFLDMSEGEMAQALACAPGTVKSRLHRALTRLRSMLAVQEAAG